MIHQTKTGKEMVNS